MSEETTGISNASRNKSYEFNTDPAIKGFTWDQLLKYNISFLKGEKKSTFYHAGPLVSDQVPADLIKLHEKGVLTIDGQGSETRKGYARHSGEYYEIKQRAYLECYMFEKDALKIIEESKKGLDVIFTVKLAKTGEFIYISPEIKRDWDTTGAVSLTQERGAPSEKELEEMDWEMYTNYWKHIDKFETLEEMKFKHFYNWVCDGLCHVMMIDKEYSQVSPHSLPARMVAYLSSSTGGRRARKTYRRGIKQKKRGRTYRRR